MSSTETNIMPDLTELGIDELPPTEDELPYDDGVPMETPQHAAQMTLLIETLRRHWHNRATGFVGGNMFVYFDIQQTKGRYFRGPDFFAVIDAPKRNRKSWVVWQEGMGPDIVIELLSQSTRTVDQGEKLLVYQDQLRVPEYYWFDPVNGELAGFTLRDGRYEPIQPDGQGNLYSRVIGLKLMRWHGRYSEIDGQWLRLATPEGVLLPTEAERAETAEDRAMQALRTLEAAQREAEAAQREAEAAQREAEAAQREAEAAQREAEAAQREAEAAQREAEAARQRIAELEALLAQQVKKGEHEE